MSQTPSTTFSFGFTGVSAIPPKPSFQDIQFKVIGQEPALLMRFSNMSPQLPDDFDIDDIYEDPPLPPSATDIAVEGLPSATCSRPTLLQSLAGAVDLTDPNVSPTTISSADSTSVPHNISDATAPPAVSGPRRNTSSTVSLSRTTFSPSNTIRETLTRPPSTDLLPPSSDHNQVSHHKSIDNAKTFKKVVALKDKFMTVSATARQSQRFAKQAMINAQRSAAAAQSCFVAAESFVPCIREVISAIHRMGPATESFGSSSEWTALLRDLKDGLDDLKQWSSGDLNDPFDASLGQHSLRLQNPSPPPSPPSLLNGTISRVSSTGFLLTSVEEEAQQALRAWNQLDQQIRETDDPGRESGSQSGPEPLVQNTQPSRMETELESSRHQEKERSRVSEEDLDKRGERHEKVTFQGRGQKSVEAEATMQTREVIGLQASTETARINEPKGGSGDDQNQGLRQQQPKETSEASTGSQDDDSMTVAKSDVASKRDLPERHRRGSNLTTCHHKSIGPISKTQDVSSPVFNRDAHNLQPALATSIGLEQAQTSISDISSSNMQADQRLMQPPLFSPAVVRVAPRSALPSVYSNSANNSGENDKNPMVQPKVTLPVAQHFNSKQPEDCPLSIKTEFVELKLEMDERKVVQIKSDTLKSESETPKVPLSPKSSATGRPSSRIPSIDVPGPLREDISPSNQVELPSPVGSIVAGPFKATAALHGSHPKVVNNNVPSAQPTLIPVSADPPASPPFASPPSQQAIMPARKAHPPPAPVRFPKANPVVPAPLGVARSPFTQDLDDPISPDLLSSRGWAADKQGLNKGRREIPDKAVPRRTRAQKKANNGSPSQAKGQPASSNSVNSPSKSPIRRPIPSDPPPAPLIGKKRQREEESHPGPSSERREWRGASFSETERVYIPTEPRARANANANAPLATSVPERGQNSHNSQHSGASLIHRLDAASKANMEVSNQLEPRIQNPPWPQQAHLNRHRGYDSYRPSYQGHDRTPELLFRMQGVQQENKMLDHGHSNLGRVVNRPQRPHGRGRGNGGQIVASQQTVSRKTPLIDRMHK